MLTSALSGSSVEALRGKVTFDPVKPEDLIDIVRSVADKTKDGTSITFAAPGIGVDELLEWSLTEVRSAQKATTDSDRRRHATNALMSGRRALSCLVEWYLARDGFSYCRNAPKGAEDKAKTLLDRKILDDLTLRVLPRAIQERDRVEHQFEAASLEQAEDFVELIRRTIRDLRIQSEPSRACFVFGQISFGILTNPAGTTVSFHGWISPCFVFCTLGVRPWLGAIVPDGTDKSSALVRRVYFDEVTPDLLLSVLQVVEESSGPPSQSISRDVAKLLLAECGLINLV